MASSPLASDVFYGVLKYNTVFVYKSSYLSLRSKGYGARVVYNTSPAATEPTLAATEPALVATEPALATDRSVANSATMPHNASIELSSLSNDVIDSALYREVLNELVDMDVTHNNDINGITTTPLALTLHKADNKTCVITPEEDYMILMDEEAFYLYTQKFIVITINTQDGEPVANEEYLWSKFYEKNHKFPLKYTVFKYFRDQRYCVKTGCNFGMDYAVYRLNPNRCHSEMCAIVVDASTPEGVCDNNDDNDNDNGNDDNGDGYYDDADADGSPCQLGWRHISTLTRVMPDVMKQLLICYVLRGADPLSSGSTDKKIDYSTSKCVDQLRVRPVTTQIRRQFALEKSYMTVLDVQSKIRAGSVLKAPRKQGAKKKKMKKRRDPEEVRKKVQSKHGKLWGALARPIQPTGSGNNNNNNNNNSNNKSKQKEGQSSAINHINKKQEKRKQQTQEFVAGEEESKKKVKIVDNVHEAPLREDAESADRDGGEAATAASAETPPSLAATPETGLGLGSGLAVNEGENNIFEIDVPVLEPTKVPTPVRETRRSSRLLTK